MDDMSGAGSTAQVQTPEQVLDWARATYGLTLTTGQQWEVANAIGFTGSNWVPDMAGKAMAYIATEAGRHNIPRVPVTPTITPEHVRRMATLTKFHIAAFKELKVDEAIREAITRMGPTQAAALVMQEQAKAEATRVAALRARGIAADPRPATNMEEAQQVIAFLMTDGVTGALRPLADNALAGLTTATESASLAGEGVEGTARVARHHQCWTGRDIEAMDDLVYKLHQGATIAEAGTVFLGASGAVLAAFASGITAIVFGIGEYHFSRVLIQMQNNQC